MDVCGLDSSLDHLLTVTSYVSRWSADEGDLMSTVGCKLACDDTSILRENVAVRICVKNLVLERQSRFSRFKAIAMDCSVESVTQVANLCPSKPIGTPHFRITLVGVKC
jgi:hypothetical protein